MLQGKFIGVKESTNVFAVEKKFVSHACEQAVLRATTLDLYFVELNGVRVGGNWIRTNE